MSGGEFSLYLAMIKGCEDLFSGAEVVELVLHFFESALAMGVLREEGERLDRKGAKLRWEQLVRVFEWRN